MISLIVAIPVDYSSEILAVPSFSYEDDGRTAEAGFLARGTSSSHPLSRPRRASWAPSLTRSESYVRKVMDIIGRPGGNKVHRADEMTLRDVVNVLRYWNQRRDREPDDAVAAAGFGEPADEANLGRNYEGDEILVAEVSPEAFARWRQDPRRDYEGLVEVRIEGEGGNPEEKRGDGAQPGPRPLYIGFGQHAANAAIDAFEGILDEGKNEKQERHQNPVRFLGKR